MSDIKVPADAKKDEWDQSAGGSFDSSCDTLFTYQEKGEFLAFWLFFSVELNACSLKKRFKQYFLCNPLWQRIVSCIWETFSKYWLKIKS